MQLAGDVANVGATALVGAGILEAGKAAEKAVSKKRKRKKVSV